MNIKRDLGIVAGFVFIVALWFTASFIATENAKAKYRGVKSAACCCCCCDCDPCGCECGAK